MESIAAPIEWFGGLCLFAAQAIRECFQRPFEWTEILRQTYQIGWQSAPLIVLSGLAVGSVLSMHTRATLERFGAESMIPTALAFALVKETGPLVTGLLISGRVGAGIGAGLGSAMGWMVASQGLAFSMPWYVPTFAFGAILSVCALAAWLSLRQVFKLEPAIVFKA